VTVVAASQPPRSVQLRGATMKPETIKRIQIILTALFVLGAGGFGINGALNPNPAWHDYQQVMVNLEYHPIASILGG
jgi:hypothetical protein